MSVFWGVTPCTDAVDEFAVSFFLDKLFCLFSLSVIHLVS